MKDIVHIFLVFILSIFVYYDPPILGNVSIIALWAVYSAASIVLFILAPLAWEEMKQGTKEALDISSTSKNLMQFTMLGVSVYVIYLAGHEYLATLMTLNILMAAWLIVSAIIGRKNEQE